MNFYRCYTNLAISKRMGSVDMNRDPCIISSSGFCSGKCFAVEFSNQDVVVAEAVFLSFSSRLPLDESLQGLGVEGGTVVLGEGSAKRFSIWLVWTEESSSPNWALKRFKVFLGFLDGSSLNRE